MGLYKERQFGFKIKSITKDLSSIVVKPPISVVKWVYAYANQPFIDVLCILWNRPIGFWSRKEKRPCQLAKTLLREHYMKMKKITF